MKDIRVFPRTAAGRLGIERAGAGSVWNAAAVFVRAAAVLSLATALSATCLAQGQNQMPGMQMPGIGAAATSTDLFIMLGSDFVRPGWLTKANYNIGIGHMFGFLKKDPLGDELTAGYTFEDAGSGFWASRFGSDTESLGVMRNFGLPKTKRLTGYTWIQVGVATFTGGSTLQNHFYNGDSIGAVVHVTGHNSIWIQEMLNVIPTVPVYTTTSIGYTRSW